MLLASYGLENLSHGCISIISGVFYPHEQEVFCTLQNHLGEISVTVSLFSPPAVVGAGMRPGSRAMGAGAQGAFGSQVRVADRPVTQHGVAGMKTGMKGEGRGEPGERVGGWELGEKVH